MRYEFISKNTLKYPVEKMCQCMQVSKNAYYYWINSKEKLEVITSKSILKNRITCLFKESKEVYGSYRIQKQLEREGFFYCRSYIAVLMKEMGLKSVLRRKFVTTTDSNHSYRVADNLLNREFTSYSLGEKWVSDITYVRVKEDWHFLTTIIDLADRKVVGWSLSEDMTVKNTIVKAWIAARNTRSIHSNLIFHSDRGVQYASKKMDLLIRENIKVTKSMSRKGNCWDNAVAESFFKTIKYECLNRYKFSKYEELYQCIEEYLNWYNTQRLHSSLGYKTPLEKELELRGLLKNVA